MAKERKERTIGIQSIGKLEAEIFKMICDHNEATVRDIYEELRKKRQIAYTTVMSVMNSLTIKKMLKQDRSAMAYVYKPTISNEELAMNIIQTIADKLLDGNVKPVISYFNNKK